MKKINRISVVVLAAVSALVCLSSCASAPVGPHPSANGITTSDDGKMRTEMTSAEFIKEMGVGFNLGNTMEAYWSGSDNKTSGCSLIGMNTTSDYETCWGEPLTTQERIDGMKAAGFDTVRIPVYWGNMMADDGTFTISADYFNRVEEIINYCRNNGLYTIINIHHYDEYIIKNFSEDEAVAAVEKLWTQIAERYKEYSDYLIFEGFNENLGTTRESDKYSEAQKFDYVNRMNRTFVDAVRKSGGNNAQRMLIVSGYWTNIDKTTTDKFIVPTDTVKDRIMVSVHYVDNAMYWTNKIGTQQWLDYAKAQCELLKKAFTEKGIQVVLGETTSIYGRERFGAEPLYKESSECLKIILDMLTDYGFTPILWDAGSNFYSRTGCKIKSETDAAVIAEIAEKINPAPKTAE